MMSEEEYEEKEILIYVDFNSKIDDELFADNKELKIIGLDSETPVLQVANQVFQGEWKDSLGTQVLFEEDDNPPKYDTLFAENPEISLKYFCKTDKILRMSRVFVNPKSSKPDEPTNSTIDS